MTTGAGWTAGCDTGEAWIGTWKRENAWLGGSMLAASSDSAAANGRWLDDGSSYRFLGPCDGVGGAGRFSPRCFLASASAAMASHSGLPDSF